MEKRLETHNFWGYFKVMNKAMLIKRPVTVLAIIIVALWGINFLYTATDRSLSEYESHQVSARRRKHQRMKVTRLPQTEDDSSSFMHFKGNAAPFVKGGMLLDSSSIKEKRKEMFRKFDKIHEDENLRSRRKKMLAKLDRLHVDSYKDMGVAGVDGIAGIEAILMEENASVEEDRVKFMEDRKDYLLNVENQVREMARKMSEHEDNENKNEEIGKDGNETARAENIHVKDKETMSNEELEEEVVNSKVSNNDSRKRENGNGLGTKEKNTMGKTKHRQSSVKHINRINKGEQVKGRSIGNKSHDNADIDGEGRTKDNGESRDSKETKYKKESKDSKESKDRKDRKDNKDWKASKDSKDRKEGKSKKDSTKKKESMDRNGSKDTKRKKESNDSKDRKDRKDWKNRKDSKERKESKDRNGSKESKDSKARKDWKNRKDSKERKESKDSNGSKDSKDSKEKKERKDRKESQDKKERKGRKDNKERKESKGIGITESELNIKDRKKKQDDITYKEQGRNDIKVSRKLQDSLGKILRGNILSIDKNDIHVDMKESKISSNKKRKNEFADSRWRDVLSNEVKKSNERRTGNKNENLLMKAMSMVKALNKQGKLNDKLKSGRRKVIDDSDKEHRRRENFYGRAANIKNGKET